MLLKRENVIYEIFTVNTENIIYVYYGTQCYDLS